MNYIKGKADIAGKTILISAQSQLQITNKQLEKI